MIDVEVVGKSGCRISASKESIPSHLSHTLQHVILKHSLTFHGHFTIGNDIDYPLGNNLVLHWQETLEMGCNMLE